MTFIILLLSAGPQGQRRQPCPALSAAATAGSRRSFPGGGCCVMSACTAAIVS